jgi:hypothetical protein
MRTDKPDEHYAELVLDGNNEPVFIPLASGDPGS